MAVSYESRIAGASGVASSSTAHLRSSAGAKARPVVDLSISPATNGHPRQPYASARMSAKGKERAEQVEPRPRFGDKAWVNETFSRFGEHCARNQVRTL